MDEFELKDYDPDDDAPAGDPDHDCTGEDPDEDSDGTS